MDENQLTEAIEQWKPVPTWETIYEVSDHGRIRSLDREVVDKNGVTYRYQSRVLAPNKDRKGHLSVQLYRAGFKKKYAIHRLVLEAFVGGCPIGMECCHNDGNPENNRLDNLRWDTKSANAFDMVNHGVHNHSRKTECKRGHSYEEWNLVPSTAKRGGRQCRACHRGAIEARRLGLGKDAIQELSDQAFARFQHISS